MTLWRFQRRWKSNPDELLAAGMGGKRTLHSARASSRPAAAGGSRSLRVFDVNERLLESIELSPIATVISNPRLADNPLEVANAAFCALTGYSESEIVGRNCRFLAGEATEPWVTDRIRSAIGSRRPVLVDILNYRRDGTAVSQRGAGHPVVR